MSEDLRTSLWNVLHKEIWSEVGFMYPIGDSTIVTFCQELWFDLLKRPLDELDDISRTTDLKKILHKYFFSADWHQAYDFIEFSIEWKLSKLAWPEPTEQRLNESINDVLERELAGYRLIDGKFVEVTDEREVQSLQECLHDDGFPGVQAHLRRAVRLLADREHPDYRNSIKESISAVESIAKTITGREKATLGYALAELEKKGELHSALKKGFSSLYGYTNDEDGIRHAMLEEPNLTAADAKFFLLSCTSFINYLKAKL